MSKVGYLPHMGCAGAEDKSKYEFEFALNVLLYNYNRGDGMLS
jgi:hypothetical protein